MGSALPRALINHVCQGPVSRARAAAARRQLGSLRWWLDRSLLTRHRVPGRGGELQPNPLSLASPPIRLGLKQTRMGGQWKAQPRVTAALWLRVLRGNLGRSFIPPGLSFHICQMGKLIPD